MKPILFNIDEVKAILVGRKTKTRQPIKPKYKDDEYGFNVITNNATGEQWVEKHDDNEASFCPTRYVNPKYNVGDILYVRETWKPCFKRTIKGMFCEISEFYGYKADLDNPKNPSEFYEGKWKSPASMPKEAARIFLRVTAVRIERVEDWEWVYEFERCEKLEVTK